MRKIGRRVAALAAGVALTTSLVVSGAPPASAAVGCGDAEVNWASSLASVWSVELYIDSTDYDGVLVVTNAGNETALTNLDTFDAYNGSYAVIGGGAEELDWSATTPVLGNPFDRLTFQTVATACGVNDRVTAAAGSIIRQDEGVVGVAYMTRVL